MKSPQELFSAATGHAQPYTWQRELMEEREFKSRLVRIPTGFGKTDAVLMAWVYNALIREDTSWPRRLVLCLPMRTLVEQTHGVVMARLRAAGLLGEAGAEGVAVHLLMGGSTKTDWHLYPDQPAVLIGTMDMLLSRALNRGYAASRARWPIEFGLLHQDALWVFDEVQLMDAGLATSAQLEALRLQFESPSGRPSGSWWVSATLQRDWLSSPEAERLAGDLPLTALPEADRQAPLWRAVSKPARVIQAVTPKEQTDAIVEAVEAHPDAQLTIVVVNTVKSAQELYKRLQKAKLDLELSLIHSRFRPSERKDWYEQLVREQDGRRLIVSTQVIEAGVDLDADLLITELAPWPSLVQRLGRLARTGGVGHALILDPLATKPGAAAPYELESLDAARSLLTQLAEGLEEGEAVDLSPRALDAAESGASDELLASLYPYDSAAILTEADLIDLFDTSADLAGQDIDISRFIRSGDERDSYVFWVDLPKDAGSPDAKVTAPRDGLCPVPFLDARAWLCESSSARLRDGKRAWVWDYVEGRWVRANADAITPGRVILVASDSGGYSLTTGFDAKSKKAVPIVPISAPTVEDEADRAEEREALSQLAQWKTIATHCHETAEFARDLASELLPRELQSALRIAALWHDIGKAHPVFQGSIVDGVADDLAKAPSAQWSSYRELYPCDDFKRAKSGRRPGFRHELASMLALFAVIRRYDPSHEALLGPWLDLFEAPPPHGSEPATPAEAELIGLDAATVDLIAYLVLSHHGKIRVSLQGAATDQGYPTEQRPIRGVFDGDSLPATRLEPEGPELPELELGLSLSHLGLSPITGRSWADRVSALIAAYGPFRLAFMEACMRAADVRASRLTTPDPLLEEALK